MDRKIIVSKDAFKEIIFGNFMLEDQQSEIKEACHKHGLKVAFYQSFVNNGVVKINNVKN